MKLGRSTHLSQTRVAPSKSQGGPMTAIPASARFGLRATRAIPRLGVPDPRAMAFALWLAGEVGCADAPASVTSIGMRARIIVVAWSAREQGAGAVGDGTGSDGACIAGADAAC